MNPRIVEVRKNILKKNDVAAARLRDRFRTARMFVASLVSSPGAGKTSFLERTLTLASRDRRLAALVGDLATERDAERLRHSGVPVRQITTGTVCHLDAEMTERALQDWLPADVEWLFVENVRPSSTPLPMRPPPLRQPASKLSARYNVWNVNALSRIARLLLVVALSFGAPLPSMRADEAVAFGPSPCRSQLLVCAKLQQSEARAALVSARESTQFSLKSSNRSSPWQAAVLLTAACRSTVQNSLSLLAGGRITLAAAGLAARPVRAPPATT